MWGFQQEHPFVLVPKICIILQRYMILHALIWIWDRNYYPTFLFKRLLYFYDVLKINSLSFDVNIMFEVESPDFHMNYTCLLHKVWILKYFAQVLIYGFWNLFENYYFCESNVLCTPWDFNDLTFWFWKSYVSTRMRTEIHILIY